MSQRGKRGLSRCKKNYPAESYTVTFNDLGLVDSDTASRFASWMGVEVRARISYLKGWKQVTKEEKDQMWLKAKVTWNISDDVASEHKKVLFRKMNEHHRKFKTNLTHIAQAGKDPLLEYKDLNMEDWPAFVAIRNSPAFLEKSAKAKENALKNKDRPKLNEALQVNLDWTFPQCNQQRETWECGYYVMKWILDFFMVVQQGFPDNIPTHFISRKPLPMLLLNKMVLAASKTFYDTYCQPCKESI